MDPSGPNAADLRELVGRAQALAERAGAEAAASADARGAAVGQLGENVAAAIDTLAQQLAAELAADAAGQLDAQVAADRESLAAERAELESQREAWLAERSEWEAVRDEVEAELAAQEARLEASTEDRQAGDAASTAENERLRGELAELKATLGDADRALHESAELRQKFDIALADLQSHRSHIAELEAQLATRPEADADESAELAQLRQERDDLWRELEAARANPGQGDQPPGDEEWEGLRRRFELAVEEVRELKTENAALQQRAASAPASGGDAAGDDWESQKRRLLAELESEGEPQDQARVEERATIAGTIQITDEVVAEKDREIQRLTEQLSGDEARQTSDQNNAVLDQDEVIRQERERLAGLEAEWEEKLRSAELELSVERAKIARAQSEIAEQQLELETLRAAAAASGGGGEGEASRKWLNKLGLGAGGEKE